MPVLQEAVVSGDLSASLPCLRALHTLPEAVMFGVLPAVLQAASRAGLHSCGDDLWPLQGFQQTLADLPPSHILSEINSSSHISPEELDLLFWMLSLAKGLQTTPRAWRTSHPYPQRAVCWDSGPA